MGDLPQRCKGAPRDRVAHIEQIPRRRVAHFAKADAAYGAGVAARVGLAEEVPAK
jgi:catalase